MFLSRRQSAEEIVGKKTEITRNAIYNLILNYSSIYIMNLLHLLSVLCILIIRINALPDEGKWDVNLTVNFSNAYAFKTDVYFLE